MKTNLAKRSSAYIFGTAKVMTQHRKQKDPNHKQTAMFALQAGRSDSLSFSVCYVNS